MQKFVSVFLSVVICISLTTSAYAADDVRFAEYADVGAGAYYDTGEDLFGTDKYKVVLDVNVKAENECFFGAKYESCEYEYNPEYNLTSVLGYSWRGIVGLESSENIPRGRHTIEFISKDILDGDVYVDGVKAFSTKNVSCPSPTVYLFGTHVDALKHQKLGSPYIPEHEDRAENTGNVTFYSYQIYKKDQLIHNYVPAVVKSSGKPVVYDLVTKSYKPYLGNSDNITNYNLSETPYNNNTATIFSAGNIWIILGILVLTLGIIVAVVIRKKRTGDIS